MLISTFKTCCEKALMEKYNPDKASAWCNWMYFGLVSTGFVEHLQTLPFKHKIRPSRPQPWLSGTVLVRQGPQKGRHRGKPSKTVRFNTATGAFQMATYVPTVQKKWPCFYPSWIILDPTDQLFFRPLKTGLIPKGPSHWVPGQML